MNQPSLKRPRGRPPKDPTKARVYRKKIIRFCKNGKPRKERGVASMSQVEAWIEKEGHRFWTGSGRPPAGSRSIIQALMTSFGISRRTVTRILCRINARRDAQRKQSLHVRTPAELALVAALTERYQNRSLVIAPSGQSKSASTKIAGMEVLARQAVASEPTGNGRQILHDKSGQTTLEQSLSQWIRESRDPGALREINDLIARRLGALLQDAGVRPPGRGLDAIGLRVGPTVRRASPIDQVIRESLQESLDAYLASGMSTPRIKALGSALIKEMSAQSGP